MKGDVVESNYNYIIKTEIKIESRKSYIKHLRAMILYMEEEVTDEGFHLMALGLKTFPGVETFKVVGVEEI